MWLNTNTNEVVSKPKSITVGGIQYPSVIFQRFSEVELNAIGLYSIAVNATKENSRYYYNNEVKNLDVEPYTIHYEATEKPLDMVKQTLLNEVSKSFKSVSARPVVDTGLGYFVDGSHTDLMNFQIGKDLGVDTVIDVDGQAWGVVSADYDTILTAIKAKGLALYQAKWAKEATIASFTTVAECIAYENDEYIYTITAEDVAENPLLVEGDTETRVRNLCTEW